LIESASVVLDTSAVEGYLLSVGYDQRLTSWTVGVGERTRAALARIALLTLGQGKANDLEEHGAEEKVEGRTMANARGNAKGKAEGEGEGQGGDPEAQADASGRFHETRVVVSRMAVSEDVAWAAACFVDVGDVAGIAASAARPPPPHGAGVRVVVFGQGFQLLEC
jgi:hypothetical protein